MGKIDFSAMKLKLIASIVAISAIYLLRAFMSIGLANTPQYTSEQYMWLVIIHVVFVVSGVLLALMDFIAERGHTEHPEHAAGEH